MKKFLALQHRLAAAGNGNPKRSAEELTAHVLGCKPLEVYFREPTPEQDRELESLMRRAEQGEPIQYLIGHVDFRGLEIRCDRRALIPRPETELLVEEVLRSNVVMSKVEGQETIGNRVECELGTANAGQRSGNRHSAVVIADVGCGTGCIGLALLAELPNAEVVAVDCSPDALALARENAERLGLSARFTAVQGNLLNVDATSSSRLVDGGIANTFFEEASLDIVVSNPPYILSEVCKTLDRSVIDYEPHLALDGGADGLALIRPLVAQAARVLKPGGGLFLEIGYDQGAAVFQCLEQAGFENVRIVKDLAGLDRIVCGEWL